MLDIHTLIGTTLPAGEPELRAMVVTTLTGSTSVRGTSGKLGNATDTALLLALREWSDAVFVGSNTVKAEDYGGVMLSDAAQEERVARGQKPVPPVAVVSSSLNFNVGTKFFREAPVPPIIITDNTDPEKLAPLQQVGVRIIPVGTTKVGSIVDKLRGEGFARIVCEGGATLFAQVVDAGLVDIWHHTIDPTLTSSVEQPVVRGGGSALVPLTLEASHADADSMLFLRYRRR